MIRILGVVVGAILCFFIVSSMIVFTAPYIAVLVVLTVAVRTVVNMLEGERSEQ